MALTKYQKLNFRQHSHHMGQVFTAAGGSVPIDNYAATGAPGTGDDSADGYSVGSVWIDVTGDDAYICLDSTAGSAAWKKTTP